MTSASGVRCGFVSHVRSILQRPSLRDESTCARWSMREDWAPRQKSRVHARDDECVVHDDDVTPCAQISDSTPAVFSSIALCIPPWIGRVSACGGKPTRPRRRARLRACIVTAARGTAICNEARLRFDIDRTPWRMRDMMKHNQQQVDLFKGPAGYPSPPPMYACRSMPISMEEEGMSGRRYRNE